MNFIRWALICKQFVDIAFGNNGDLTMSEIKQTSMILTVIGNDDNSGTRELNNQDGKNNEEKIACYVCSRFWNGAKFMNVYDWLNLMWNFNCYKPYSVN